MLSERRPKIRQNNKSKENSYDENNMSDMYNLSMKNKKVAGRSSVIFLGSSKIKIEDEENPYGEAAKVRDPSDTKSRDSSMSKSSMHVKKPPTVPKPFRLSTSN